MNKLVYALALCGLVSTGTSAVAADSPHTFTGNLGLYSDYAFRGVSQTAGEPAIQGGFDYAHASGFYLGTWASNITEAMYTMGSDSSNMEWDFYGGYAGKVNDDLGYNVGLLKYYYPGATDFDTLELYGALTYKWFGAKLSYNIDDYFGVADSDGTIYTDLSFNYELPAKVMLGLHYGITTSDVDALEYNDWKIGVTKDFSGFVFGLAYTDTDLDEFLVKGEDVNDGRLIVSVSKTF